MDLVFAYGAPGTGSLIIQAIIAGAVAIPLFFRNQIIRGVSAVKRALGKDRTDTAPER